MIPAIGLMVGCYIVTRMLELRKSPWAEPMAFLTIAVTLLLMLVLLAGGVEV